MTTKLLTKRQQIRDLPNVLKAHFARPGFGSAHWTEEHKQEILKKLNALDLETATAEDCNEITKPVAYISSVVCDNCGQRVWSTVQLGEEPDHESSTANVCLECLLDAVRQLTLEKNQ